MFRHQSCPIALLLTVTALAAAAQEHPRRQFPVADFGAAPGTGRDAGPGIRAAIAAAVACGEPAEVVLGQGVYHVGREPAGEYAVSVLNARDLIVRGEGARTEIVVTDPQAGCFRLSGCRRTVVAGLTIDYSPPPYGQSTVVAVDHEKHTFDILPEEGFLQPDDPAFAAAKATWGLIVRPESGDAPTHFGPTAIPTAVQERLGGGRWRMSVSGPPTGYPDPLRTSGMTVGDRFVQPARNYSAAVSAGGCDDLVLEDITIHSSPGVAVLPYLCGGVTIRDCHVLRRPGTARLLSTNADGVHCRGARRGIAIEACSFEGMADDAINIHSSPIPVLRVVSPTELVVQRYHYTLLEGDTVEALDPEECRVRGQANVLSVEEVPDRWEYHIRLDAPIEGLRAGTDFGDSDCLYNLSECASGSTVKDCHFGSFRGRGVLLSCVGASVTGNTFEVTEGWGVVLHHESTRWAEGPLPRDIEIVANRFVGKGGYQAAIIAYPQRRDGKMAAVREIRGLRIEGNLFEDLGAPAVELHACREVSIRDNGVRTGGLAARPRKQYQSIVVDNCTAVEIAGLTVHDADPRHSAAVRVTAATDGGEQGVRVSGLDLEMAPGAVAIQDERRAAGPQHRR